MPSLNTSSIDGMFASIRNESGRLKPRLEGLRAAMSAYADKAQPA